MNSISGFAFFIFVLFSGMLILLELGRRLGLRRAAADPELSNEGIGAIDGAIFALLGLLIAFTFTGAATRFDARRAMIVQETNDIGTAWLRLDLLPADSQPELRDAFRRYVDARLETYRTFSHPDATREAAARAAAIQTEIWKQAVSATREGAHPSASMLLLPALNAMFDISTTRAAAMKMHPPMIIFAMLTLIALISSLLAGHGMARARTRSLTHMIGFALIIALVVYTILDIEYPRRGLIRVNDFDELLVDLRRGMD